MEVISCLPLSPWRLFIVYVKFSVKIKFLAGILGDVSKIYLLLQSWGLKSYITFCYIYVNKHLLVVYFMIISKFTHAQMYAASIIYGSLKWDP